MLSDSSSKKIIHFFQEDIDFELRSVQAIRQWLSTVLDEENNKGKRLHYIFCSDAYLLQLNIQYLQHDTLTDIITFSDSREGQGLAGDIFISIERIRENAALYEVNFEEELRRVMVHGLLHLLGYKDKTKAEKKRMREKEDYYLAKYSLQ